MEEVAEYGSRGTRRVGVDLEVSVFGCGWVEVCFGVEGEEGFLEGF
jgi:hypothetical protein